MTHKITRRKMIKDAAITGASALAAGAWSWAASTPAAWAAQADNYSPHVGPLDTLIFGDAASETAHATATTFSDVIAGALNQPARVFNPASPATYFGGTVSFTMAVAPAGTNYVTIKLWGSDTQTTIDPGGTTTRFILFAEGKEVGWQNDSSIDVLDTITTYPRFFGRFFFNTVPLPESLTAGKTSIKLEIRAAGNFTGSADATQAYPDYTTGVTRPAYRLYTHTSPYFMLAADDPQGEQPNPGVRPSDPASASKAVVQRVENDVLNYYYGTISDLWSINALAEAIITPGTIAYQDPAALDRIFKDLDAVYTLWTTNQSAFDITQQQWQGLGRVGYVLALIWDQVGDRLDQRVVGETTEFVNGNVEAGISGPIGWSQVTWSGTATFVWDDTVAHSGTHSLKLVPAAAGFGPGWYKGKINIEQGTYQYSTWVKMENATGQGPYMMIMFYNAAGDFLEVHKFYAPNFTGTNDWQQIVGVLDTPTNATQFEMYLGSNDTGTAWYDDMALTQLASGPIPNNSFEIGSGSTVTGWGLVTWSGTATMSWDAMVAHSGTHSLKLAPTAAGYGPGLYPGKRIAVGQSTYNYSAWVKMENATGQGPYIMIMFYNAAGNFLEVHKFYAPVPSGTNDWQQIVGKVTTPTNATQFEMYLGSNDTGTAWFDDVSLTDLNTPVSPVRRDVYKQILKESRDYWRQNMPHFSNQVQICSMGIYQANRGLLLLESSDALPEPQARKYIYRSLGLLPFCGPEDANGVPSWELGHSYLQVSPQGLSRELGFVGTYGEILDWLCLIYDSVNRGYKGIQDNVLLERMKAIAKGRSVFRYPGVDSDGNRCYWLESTTGWRDGFHPVSLVYAQRHAWDGHGLQLAAVTRDHELAGWAQRQLDDHQFGGELDNLATYYWSRVGLNAQRYVYRDLAAFQALHPQPGPFPMDPDQPDFVFSDETNAMVAIKHGTEILYVNLYHRARQAVNNYARIHYITPTFEHTVVARVQSLVTRVGTWTVPDWILWDWSVNTPGSTGPGDGLPSGNERPAGYNDLHQAFAGVTMPINHYPSDVSDPALGIKTPGVETVFVGKADFYRCAYGPYLIACNTTSNQTFLLDHGEGDAIHVHTGNHEPAGRNLKVPPMTTVVLYRPAADWKPSKMWPVQGQGSSNQHWS